MPMEAGTIRIWCCVRQCKYTAASLCPFSAQACESSWCSDFYGNRKKINVIKEAEYLKTPFFERNYLFSLVYLRA